MGGGMGRGKERKGEEEEKEEFVLPNMPVMRNVSKESWRRKPREGVCVCPCVCICQSEKEV